MRRKVLLFLAFCGCFRLVCGQDVTFHDTLPPLSHSWQEQLLQQVDADELGDQAYSQLIDELSELVVWTDTTTRHARTRQHLVLSSSRCLSARAGYDDQSAARQEAGKAYLGDPWHHSVRYRAETRHGWQVGLTLDKDPGEAWHRAMPVFDSWHGFVRRRQPPSPASPAVGALRPVRIADAVVGHYRLRMGCGLVVHQGFALGKQYLTQQLLTQRSNVLTPQTSLSESGYMQGAAADLRLGPHLTLLPYISARRIDGSLSSAHVLTSLPTDGYHRTHGEKAKRNAAWQTVTGARLGWRGQWFDAGLHATYTHLQYEYRRQPNYYNTHYFRGHELTHLAADYSAHALGCALRGEVAVDDHGALAMLHALQYPLGHHWRGALLHRYYGGRYRQLHASSVRESSAMQGEQGVLLSIEGQPTSRWQAQAMLDWFRFSQPQYGIRDATSQGFEGSLRLGYTGSRHRRCPMTAHAAYRIKQKGAELRQSADLVATLQPHRHLTCRTQLRARIYNKEGATPTHGLACSQSAAWQGQLTLASLACPLTLEGQACWFRTGDYASRVYLTERTILYGFGLPMLYGKGLRYSLTATLGIGPRLHLDLKWALTNYADRTAISSGLQQIAGNNQHDLWLQLRARI